MIDKKASLEKFEEREAIEKLRKHIKDTKKTQAEIAREMGLSDAAVSSFLKGSYQTPHTIVVRVNDLLDINERKAASPKEPEFKMTSISEKVTNIITYCHLQGKIAVAYGDAGIGKTMAIKEYLKNNKEAIGITTSPCFSTISGVNELLADELKIKEKVSRRIYKELVYRLKGSNKVIIIDEAQHLTARVINHIRSINDESNCGIALIGNEEVYLKMIGTGQATYAQLFSRIGNRSHLLTTHIKKSDIELIFEDAGLDEEAVNILFKISKTNYGLRGAVNVYVNTMIAFEINNFKDLTAAKIARMAKEMNIA